MKEASENDRLLPYGIVVNVREPFFISMRNFPIGSTKRFPLLSYVSDTGVMVGLYDFTGGVKLVRTATCVFRFVLVIIAMCSAVPSTAQPSSAISCAIDTAAVGDVAPKEYSSTSPLRPTRKTSPLLSEQSPSGPVAGSISYVCWVPPGYA